MASLGHESESKHLERIIDSIPSLIHTARPDGYLDYFNQRWLQYVGLPIENLLGWKWTASIHPEDVEAIVDRWRFSLASGEEFLHEARVRRADAKYRWMLHHKVAVRDEFGQIIKWYGSSIDIEDRKQAEQQARLSTHLLQRSAFYLAEAQRLGHIGSWVFDPTKGFDYWSHELFQIHGLDPAAEAPTSEQYLALVHPQDREFMASLMQGMPLDVSEFDVTKRIVRPNGEVRYVRWVGSPPFEDGTAKRIGIGIDVTEHELLTRELRRREAYLAEAQRLSHTGSFGWKPDSGEIVWSDETYCIFEYDRGAKPILDMVVQRVHPDDRVLAQRVIDRASQTGTDFEHEYRLLMPDGRVKYVHAIAHALQSACGNREFVGAVTDITETREAEAALRRSEHYLAEAQTLTHMSSWVWQVAGGDALHLSDEWYRIFGFDPEQGMPAWQERLQRVHPEDRGTWQGTIEKAIREKSGYDLEFRILLPDGTLKWIRAVAHPVLNASGELLQFVGSSMDITERKLAERTLRESETNLAEAQRLSHTGSWAWSPDHDIRYWSEECYRVLSFDPQAGLPRFEDFFQRLHPDDQPGFRELTQKAIREKAEWEAEYRIVHPDGPVRDIHVVGHPVLTASGDLVEFVGTVIDVTQRKAAEEKIREREAELRQMLDLTPQLVAVFGPNLERLYANRIALDYLGTSLDDWRDRSTASDLHPDDVGRFKLYAEHSSSDTSPYELELRVRKRDGSFRWFLVRFNPVRDDKGQVIRWYVACTDIEDRKRAEEKLQLENAALREEIDQTSMFEEIVGTSPALQTVLSRISKVAPSDSTVLITGETGTGKELVARAMHRRSQRSGRAFISVNCAAIPRDLILSELFGHEKGAFTGAMQRRLGRFEMADGGTIFLDEVGELSPDTQVALLRVLQEREFERVGGGQPIHVDVRVIAATNRDMQAAVANGIFRQDLFYRLNVFPIEVPPLRERKGDILILVEYFAQRYASRAGKVIRSIEKKTLDMLQSYDWPGNIRELQNVIERSVILSSDEVLSVDELWLSKETPRPASLLEAPPRLHGDAETRSEREIIEAALAETRGRVSGPSGAATKLRIPPSTLANRIKALKINKNQYKFG